jgi:CheY-like chemotaxis protein/HPt (histidine-containing phosphotransfer) domain-containing protein
MPGMDGFQVAQAIRDSLGLAGLTVMMLTSEGRTRDTLQCQELGMAAYLVKPIKQIELFTAITAALGLTPAAAAPVPTAAAATPVVDHRGRRILLVEDSADNRVLVLSYLRGTPCQVDVAENGQIAVEKFIAGHYDLVLMDVEMPVMDGYAATRAIRQWESTHGREPTPIVALTAYARPEDAQRSHEAGCTAHLTKPVRKPQLMQIIMTLSSSSGGVGGVEERPTDRILVRVDPELEAVIPEFLEGRRQDVASLREALERSDFETIRRLGHRMRGSGSGYGFEAITQIGESLEQAGRNRMPDEVPRWLAELANYLERVEIVSE